MASRPHKAGYTLKVEERPGYLYASIAGKKDSAELTRSAVTELAELCRARKVRKLLVEHRVPGSLPTAEVVKIACEIPELYRGIAVAYVIHSSDILPHREMFHELTLRQGATGHLFPSVEEAESWLASV